MIHVYQRLTFLIMQINTLTPCYKQRIPKSHFVNTWFCCVIDEAILTLSVSFPITISLVNVGRSVKSKGRKVEKRNTDKSIHTLIIPTTGYPHKLCDRLMTVFKINVILPRSLCSVVTVPLNSEYISVDIPHNILRSYERRYLG